MAKSVEETFGEYELVEMTAAGERGIVCQMQVEEKSLAHLCWFPSTEAGSKVGSPITYNSGQIRGLVG